MAYCVHCGVKLGETESCCPLCGTQVVDPSEPDRVAKEKSFPIHTPEQKLTMNRRFLLSLLTVTMLVPAGLCLLIDLLLDPGISWSIYPAVALSLLFVTCISPFLIKKYKLRLSIAVDGVLLALYLFMCEQLSATPGWFFPIALPALVLGCAMLVLLITLFVHKKSGILTTIAGGFLCVAILCLTIEVLHDFSVLGHVTFSWSPFVIAPCAFLSALIFFINGYQPLREEMRRRMHF